MNEVESKMKKKAMQHCDELMEHCNWLDMLEKFIEVENGFRNELVKLDTKEKQGRRLSAEDYSEIYYFKHYRHLMAEEIAREALFREGYILDEQGHFISKRQNHLPIKKKLWF